MEYFLGSVITLLSVFIVFKVTRKALDTPIQPVRYSQSNVYNLIQPFIPELSEIRRDITSQSTKHYDSAFTRVAFVDNKAYWIKENQFRVADMVDGRVDLETERQVDTMSMSKVELEKMLIIIEELTEGDQHDSSNPGN